MSQADPPRSPPRNGVGGAAMVSGVVAVVFAFVPIVGEFVAVPAALLAIALGLIGLGRVERKVATNGGEALAGCILGVVAGFVLFLVFVAQLGPTS